MKFGSETPTPITSTFTFSPVNLTGRSCGATGTRSTDLTLDRVDRIRGDLFHLRGRLQGLAGLWTSTSPLRRWLLQGPFLDQLARTHWALDILASGRALTIVEWGEVGR